MNTRGFGAQLLGFAIANRPYWNGEGGERGGCVAGGGYVLYTLIY
jgi:hypothetical protein